MAFYELFYNRTYASEDRFKAFNRDIVCVSIAAPRVLNRTLASVFCSRVEDGTIVYERIVTNGDPVPALPPSIGGFRHPCSGPQKGIVIYIKVLH